MFEDRINGKYPVETTIKLLGGKYKSTILWALRDGTLRYRELQERVSLASPKMMAEQLNEMIQDKLVCKTTYPVVPPKTEYIAEGKHFYSGNLFIPYDLEKIELLC